MLMIALRYHCCSAASTCTFLHHCILTKMFQRKIWPPILATYLQVLLILRSTLYLSKLKPPPLKTQTSNDERRDDAADMKNLIAAAVGREGYCCCQCKCGYQKEEQIEEDTHAADTKHYRYARESSATILLLLLLPP